MERGLPDRVGHKSPDHPHTGCALHDRGALSRPEGGRGLTRLRRAHEVRRSLAARGAGLGRRAGNGDGPRDPQGVLRRPPSAVLPRLRAAVHRLAVARDAARARGRLCERPVVASLGPRERRRRVGARRVETRRARRSDGRARRSARLGWSPLRRAGPMEPAARRDRAGADAARPRHRAGPGRPAALRRRRGGRRGDAARRTRAPARRSPGHDGVRPAARPIRRRPRGTARAMAGGVRRPRAAHAGMAGADHLGRPAPGGAGGTRVRSQRGGDPRPLDDRDGRRHQSLVPLRPDVPHVPVAADAVRLRGRGGRGVGALRRPGEGQAAVGLADGGIRARLDSTAAPAGGHTVLLPGDRAVALRAAATGGLCLAAGARPVRRQAHRRRQRSRRSSRLAAVVPQLRPQLARPRRRGRAGRA